MNEDPAAALAALAEGYWEATLEYSPTYATYLGDRRFDHLLDERRGLRSPLDERMSQPAISKHLRVLERAGLIEKGREAQWRPRRLRAGPLKDIADWVGEYRRHWEESFERLDAYLRDLQGKKEQGNGDDDDGDADRPR